MTIIKETMRLGRITKTANLSLHALPLTQGSSRWCFRVPRAVGNAPTRNRLKRCFREFIRTHKDLWPVKSAVVISAGSHAASLKNREVSSELEHLLSNE